MALTFADITDLSRLELLVTVLQRLHRMLSPEDQARYPERLAPYLDKSAGQYTYRIKGKAAVWEHIQQVGIVLNALLEQLQGDYEQQAVYVVALRTAIEATVFQLTHNMPHDKVPVCGRFRVTNVVLCCQGDEGRGKLDC